MEEATQDKPQRKVGKIIAIVVAVIVVIVGLWLLATYFLLGNDAESNKNATNNETTTNSSYFGY